MKKILFATNNPTKAKRFTKNLLKYDIEIVSLLDMNIKLDVEENGKDAIENALIKADNEDSRTINELKMLGLPRIRKSKKGKNSVIAGIQKLQDYKIYVHPHCMNTGCLI